MSHMLYDKQQLYAENSKTHCTVHMYLGSGGQGEVYQAEVNNQKVALKWYYPQTATSEQGRNLEMLIRKGSPTRRFLWPLDLVTSTEATGFGYTMRLRPDGYNGLVDLMKGDADPSFRSLATAGLELAHNYRELHAMGLCYRDISFGNVFFNPDTGNVLICDNDNVAIDGSSKSSVLGTPRFMAPEVVRGESRPCMETDLYSLSVLLFYIFLVHHPLEGRQEHEIKCLDLPAMARLYGTHPIFIFDPENDDNRPVPGFQDNPLKFWPIYPKFLRDLFIQAFTQGLSDSKSGRVREGEWRKTLVRLRDTIIYCDHCGAENFYDIDIVKGLNGNLKRCWYCQSSIQLPPWLLINQKPSPQIVVLNHDTQLFPHHTDPNCSFDFDKPVAELNQHPSVPNLWGLRNISTKKWVISSTSGKTDEVEPGQNVSLRPGLQIDFGNVSGEIQI